MESIGNWVLHPGRSEIRQANRAVQLSRKAMAILQCLVGASGDIVSTRELLDACWPRQSVMDSVIHKYISELRAKLGDDAKNPQYIRTIPSQGYQVITELTNSPLDTKQTDGQFSVEFFQRPAIAILPFNNLGGDPNNAYLADGIAEYLIVHFAYARMLPIVARNSSFIYRESNPDLQMIGNTLGARYVVSGTFRSDDQSAYITIEVVDTLERLQLLADAFECEKSELMTLSDQLALIIASRALPSILGAERYRAHRQTIGSTKVWDLLLRAQHEMVARDRNLLLARALFNEVIALDPASSNAQSGLAMTYYNEIFGGQAKSPVTALSNLENAATLAVELDPNNSEAHLMMGAALRLKDQPHEALESFNLALELNPSSTLSLYFLSGLLVVLGDAKEAMENLNRAIQLNPRDPLRFFYFEMMGIAAFTDRRYTVALEWARKSLRLKPKRHISNALMAASYSHLGELDKAEKSLSHVPKFSEAQVERMWSGALPELVHRYKEGLRLAGWEA